MDNKVVRVRKSKDCVSLTVPTKFENLVSGGYVECIPCKNGIFYKRIKG